MAPDHQLKALCDELLELAKGRTVSSPNAIPLPEADARFKDSHVPWEGISSAVHRCLSREGIDEVAARLADHRERLADVVRAAELLAGSAASSGKTDNIGDYKNIVEIARNMKAMLDAQDGIESTPV